MPELTADQRAGIRANAADPGLTFPSATVLALLDDLDAAEARVTEWETVSDDPGGMRPVGMSKQQWERTAHNAMKAYREQNATLALADALAADVGKWHAFVARSEAIPYCYFHLSDGERCGEQAGVAVHSDALRAFEEARA